MFDMAPSTDAAAPARREVWTRVGPDSYRVIVQRGRGEGWEDELAVTYERVR